MGNHTYQVENRRAKLTATIEGKSLKDALKREGLDPEKWTLLRLYGRLLRPQMA